MPQLLQSKERSLFQQVVKNYEAKQYKKGIKAADQILRKVPDHGDTQAMKALILNSQGQTDEAFALGKLALRNDMKSHICWHVYGLLYRSAKNFEESIKAYKMALRIEPESQQIQRDLAMLQVQMRDYAGYVQSRNAMLQARPGWRANWTALAIAQHLNGELEEAERTLTTYENTLKSAPPKSDTEHQEAIMYKNTIIAESGQTERALEHLDAAMKQVADQQSVLEMRASYLLKLGRLPEAAKVYEKLLGRNGEYRAYYEGVEQALGLSDGDVRARKALYAEHSKKNKRGDAAHRIPLDFLQGDDFREAADAYLRKKLSRGVPSAFNNMRALYSDGSKRAIIKQLVEDFKSDQSTDQLFQDAVLYFLAQHYNYHITRDLDKAAAAVDVLIERHPHSADYLMTRARIFKHYGDLQAASDMMENARTIDEKDRYINTKAAKYRLRNDQNDDALEIMSKFTKPDAPGGPLGDLVDMQSLWFITEDGESRLRQDQLGLALKRFHTVYNIYDVWQEDQFDFHSFSLRKGQIRAYIGMVRWEDQLRRHPYYTRAALGAIKAYLRLHKSPELANGPILNGNGAKSGEKKKGAKKARKEAEKQAQLEHEKRDAKRTAGSGTDGELKKVDTDTEGKQLAETNQPLEDAMKFMSPLMEHSLDDVEVQKIGFELYLQRQKWLLATRCLFRAHKTNTSDPFIHYGAIRLRFSLSKSGSDLPNIVRETVEAEAKPFLPAPEEDLGSVNDKYLAQFKDFRHQLAGLQARHYLDPARTSTSILDLADLVQQQELSLSDVMEGLEVLKGWKRDISRYTEAARNRWASVRAFQT